MDFEREIQLLHLMEQVFSSLISVSNKLQVTGDKYSIPLTLRQYMVLLGILHLPSDQATLNNIAQKIGTTKQNTAQIIGSLQKKNFLSIAPSSKDKRAINVVITELGMDTMTQTGQSVSIDFMADTFKEFTAEELEIFWKLLKKLYRFDGEELDGMEEDVKVPNTYSEQEIYTFMKRFSLRRKGEKTD
ncbi:MarR family winged helix-turn-helix transcriptional regulator [Lacrimispora algidixylanolytica]|uniref:MarR family transcriptional regulator n=1 Tax=Lacrimispora algidixylanolytica TaxID=94868 RepID=A0A419T537_9FIRM|nr:MarR family transcriptional regulator [Lacrimispora algidixylanolytica]RKD32654.1 MarR family transcriptional regulator [Lacrimispora algidixylanolytica]